MSLHSSHLSCSRRNLSFSHSRTHRPPADGEKLVGGRGCPSVATLENCSFPEEAPDKEALEPLPEGLRPQEATRSLPPTPFQKEFRNWTTRSQGPPLILPVQNLVLSPDGSRARPPVGVPSPKAAGGKAQASVPGLGGSMCGL